MIIDLHALVAQDNHEKAQRPLSHAHEVIACQIGQMAPASFKEITHENTQVDTSSLDAHSTVVPLLLADTDVNKIGRQK